MTYGSMRAFSLYTLEWPIVTFVTSAYFWPPTPSPETGGQLLPQAAAVLVNDDVKEGLRKELLNIVDYCNPSQGRAVTALSSSFLPVTPKNLKGRRLRPFRVTEFLLSRGCVSPPGAQPEAARSFELSLRGIPFQPVT